MLKTHVFAVLLLSSSGEANSTPLVNHPNEEKKHSFFHSILHSTLSPDKHDNKIAMHFQPLNAAPVSKAGDPALSQCLSEINTVIYSFFDAVFAEDQYADLLTFDDTNGNCQGFPDGNILTCDLKPVYKERGYSEYCDQVGGELQWTNLDLCSNPDKPNVSYSYIDENGQMTELQFDEMHAFGFPICAPKSCTTKMAQKYVNALTINDFSSCPKDSKSKKAFAFKIKTSNNAEKEKVTSKSCGWLANQAPSKITRICTREKFQIYKNGYLPASRMCRKTCWENDGYCIEENPSAEFLFDWEISEDGEYVPITRRCSEIAGMIESFGLYEVCYPQHDYIATKHGYGMYVCPESCASPGFGPVTDWTCL